jgi:hypothetical protein
MFLKGFLFTLLVLLIIIAVSFIPEGTVSDVICKMIGLGMVYFFTMTFRRDYFYEKCLKNKLIKPYILSGQVDFSSKTDSAAQ